MFVRFQLLTFPIHRHPRSRYYELHDRYLSRRQPALERQWGRPFEDLPQYVRLSWKDQLYWPPWQLNDLSGVLVVGADEGFDLAGDIYLKRRHFPFTAPERFNRRREGPRERGHILFFSSTAKHPVAAARPDSYVVAARAIAQEAEAIVREHARGARSSTVRLPAFDLSCIQLAEAHRQAREGSR